MTITTEQVYLLNNKFGKLANKVQLGTLIQNAETITAAEIPLTDSYLLVGNGSNVAAGVALSGDATISNTGVITIAAGAVTAAKLADNAVPKLQKIAVDYTDLTGAGTGVAALLGTAIPDNAIITRVFYDVTTTFAGDGDDSSTIKIGLEDQDNDVVAAVAISNGGNPWDAGLHDAIQDGAAANMLKHTAARQLAVTWTAVATDTTLTAGAMDVYVEYVVGS